MPAPIATPPHAAHTTAVAVALLTLAASSCRSDAPPHDSAPLQSPPPTPAPLQAPAPPAPTPPPASKPAPAPTPTPIAPANSLVIGFENHDIVLRWLGNATNELPPQTSSILEWFAAQDTTGDPTHFVFRRAFNPTWRTTTHRVHWGNGVLLRDGWLSIRMRADAGTNAPGGGIAWRVRDNSNYYVAHYDALEKALRCSIVQNGLRTQLASSGPIAIPLGQWLKLDVEARDEKFVVALDGAKKLEVYNSTFKNAGGIGLCVEDDALTSFDDFVIRPRE